MKNLFTLLINVFFVLAMATAQNPFGSGSDGALIVNEGETVTLNSERTTVRNFNSTGLNSILVDSIGGIAAGDEILIIVMQDPETDMNLNAAGTWETHYVSSAGGGEIQLHSSLMHDYDASNGSKIQVVKIPNFTQAGISGTVTCPAWDGATGGILFFRAQTNVDIFATGVVSSSGKGYRGGTQYGDSYGGGQGGESFMGAGGFGGTYTSDPHGKVGAGGGGAAYAGYNGGDAIAGGGGGATNGNVGLGSTNVGGAGGGGGGHAGSGGGAGYGTFGFGGYSYTSTNNGENGGENFSGNGGSNYTGGGGGGGGTYGSAELTMLLPGSGGGCSGRHNGYNPGYGGDGGGILFISADAISNQGIVESNGNNGTNNSTYSGGGGGAAGGSIILEALDIENTNQIIALGGNGGTGHYGNNGGNGGNGRTKLNFLNLTNSGTATPEPYQATLNNILHSILPNTSNTGGPYEVSAEIFDTEGDPITDAKVYYRINGGAFSQVNMTESKSTQSFYGNIPGQAIGTEIEYYLTASDGSDNYSAPLNAPTDLYSFSVMVFPPNGLEAMDNNDGSVSISWFEPFDMTNFTDYSVYRSEQDGFTPGAFTLLSDNVTDTSFTDNTVVDFHTYYYVVSANYNVGGTPHEAFSTQSFGLLVNNTSQTTVLGYAFLENRNNHANIKVKFVPQSPSAVADSIYTNALGYFETHDIFPGVYSVRFIKDGFQTPYLFENISIVEDTDLGESMLYDMGTTVSGDVSGTWSDFISVSGNITVPQGDSLIIEPGTIIRFLGNYNLYVYGYLASNGMTGDSVRITSGPANQQQQSNQWQGIDFYNESDDNSYMNYTIIEYAYDGVYVEFASADFDHCLIQYQNRHGIYLNESENVVINSSTFKNNGNTGLYLESSTSTATGNTLTGNTSWGIRLYDYSTLHLENSLVENSGNGIRAGDASNLQMSGSEVRNITDNGLYFDDTYGRGKIEDCTFEYCGNGIYLYYRSSPKIQNNHFSFNGNGIEVYYSCDATISNNSFLANNNGIYTNTSSYGNDLWITENIFAYQTNDGIHKTGNDGQGQNTYIINNTIFNNSGDGIQVVTTGTDVIRNNVISENGNYGMNTDQYVDTLENNTVYSNAAGDFYNLGNFPAETWNFVSNNPNNDATCDIYRNINEDPLFNLSDSLDFSLQIMSKCVDGGSEDLSDPDGTISDIGAMPFDQGNPHMIYATGYGNQMVSLAWDEVTNDSITGYNVYYKTSGSQSYTLFGNTAQTLADVTGLTNNVLYDFTVTGQYPTYESTYAPKVSERAGTAEISYNPGSYSLIIPAADDSIIDNFNVTNNGSRDLNLQFPQSATESAYASFDGSGDYVSVGHHEHLAGMSALTLECWVYRQNNGHLEIMGKNFRNYQLSINSSEEVHFYKGYNNVENENYQSWDTDEYISANTWYHLAITWEGTSLKLYINGELAWEADNAVDQPIPDQYHYAFDIGRRGGENSYYLNGRVAEARVWNIARSEEEIKMYQYQSLKGDEDGLLGYWPLQEDFNDHSTYGLTGTAYGNTVLETGTRQVYSLYSVPQGQYTIAPGDTEIIPITFYKRDDLSSQFFTTTLFSDDPNQMEIDIDVALQYGETVPASPVHFIPVDETGLPYTIYITDAKIDGTTIDVGDEIGVFDGDVCVGAGIYSGEFNFIFTCWQEDPGKGEAGFTPGNPMTFKMYDTSADLETNEADEVYFIGDDTFGYGTFSALSLEASVYNIQNVAVSGGQFNLVSFNLLPHYPDAGDVFGDVSGLQIVYNDDGDVFIPGYNINTIGDINFLDGFYLYGDVNETIAFEGTFIHQEDWEITVAPAKWNYIGVPSQSPIAVTDVFAGLEEEVSIVQSASGDSWIPDQGINTLGNMLPGQGYKIALAVDTAVNFFYPPAGTKGSSNPIIANKENSQRQSNYFTVTPTGLPYAVIVRIKQANETIHSLQSGDEIGLFDGNLCVGSAVYQGEEQMLITTWQKEEAQNLPGFTTGNTIFAKVYRPDAEELTSHRLISQFGSQPAYNEGNYAITILQVNPVSETPAFFSVAPNPFKNNTEVVVELAEDGPVNVKVFDRSGRLVKVLQEKGTQSTYHKINWNGTDQGGRKLNPGVYFIIAETSTEVFTEKVIILQ